MVLWVVMWCGVMWCDVMWCDVVWCDVLCCVVMWCDVMKVNVMIYWMSCWASLSVCVQGLCRVCCVACRVWTRGRPARSAATHTQQHSAQWGSSTLWKSTLCHFLLFILIHHSSFIFIFHLILSYFILSYLFVSEHITPSISHFTFHISHLIFPIFHSVKKENKRNMVQNFHKTQWFTESRIYRQQMFVFIFYFLFLILIWLIHQNKEKWPINKKNNLISQQNRIGKIHSRRFWASQQWRCW